MSANKSLKTELCGYIDRHADEILEISHLIHANPELGLQEYFASGLLCERLAACGFEVRRGLAGLETSFRADYSSGKNGPRIAIIAEYDALPGVGHGCGHNIIATAPTGAAVALKSAIDDLGGKVVLYGTPAEECFVRKCDLAREGAFKEVDFCLNVHPFGKNLKSGLTTAIDAWQVEFYGKSSHAGVAPEEGINALDAAVHFYEMIGFEKQYLKNTNIYGVFVDAGVKCSVIPDHASVKYLVRAPRMRDIRAIRDLFERTAEACCKLVGTTYKIWNNEPGNMDVVTN